MYYIYTLVDPINRIPFYIGKGKGNRAYDHLNGYDNHNIKKKKMIDTIRMLGHEPEIHFIVENISNENYAYELEKHMIRFSGSYFGIKLTNRVNVDLRPPSRKGMKASLETRMKISEALRKRPPRKMTEDQKLAVSIRLKGKKKPKRGETYRKNIGIAKAKEFLVTYPDGTIEKIFNMREFCRKHGLSQGHLHSTTTGKRNHHKGFSAISKL